jgi:hypothetical protein
MSDRLTDPGQRWEEPAGNREPQPEGYPMEGGFPHEGGNGRAHQPAGPAPAREPEGHPPVPARAVCGARTRNGRPCQRAPLAGRTRCRLHGGASLAGSASPRFKHGRYSKYIPRGLRKIHDATSQDEELLSLKDDVRLLQTRQIQLLQRLGQAPLPPWGEAQQLFKSASEGPEQDRAPAFAALGELLSQGAASARQQEQAWAELREVTQEKAKVAAAEWKRMRDLDALVTAEQALALVMLSLDAAKETITDERMFRAFNERVLALLPLPKKGGGG